MNEETNVIKMEDKVRSHLNKSDDMVFEVMLKQHHGVKNVSVSDSYKAASTVMRIHVDFVDDTWTEFTYVIKEETQSECLR